MAIGSVYDNSGYSGYGGNPTGYNGTNNSNKNSQFWSDWKTSIMGGATQSGSGGIGSTVGGIGGSAVGSIFGPTGGMIGGQLGSVAGDVIEGTFAGEEESGSEKYKEELAKSERETRHWEERNAAPTAGIGQYLARSMALQGYPVLGAINNLDFLFNKVMPYVKNYGLKGRR